MMAPRLPVTLATDRRTRRTVNALIDSGSSRSLIDPQLVEQLGLEPRGPKGAPQVTVYIGAAQGALQGLLKPESAALSGVLLSHVKALLGRWGAVCLPPARHVPLRAADQVLIGTDLMASLLLMPASSASLSNACLSLGTANLAALQTRLGWLVQGTQTNERLQGVFEWTLYQIPDFDAWRALLAYLAFDFFTFVYFYFY